MSIPYLKRIISDKGNVEISKGVTWLDGIKSPVEVRQRLDKKINKAYIASGREGDCLSQSMRLYLKLRAAGAVRVRGTRTFDRTFTEPTLHYWVENKGYVFEESIGVQNIYKKEDFYKGEGIQDVEYARGMCFEGEFPARFSERMLVSTNDQLMKLIEIYEDRVEDELYGMLKK